MDTNDLERQLLLRLYQTAKKVCEYAWDDIDDDAKADMAALEKSLEHYESFVEIRNSAQNSLYASQMANAVR